MALRRRHRPGQLGRRLCDRELGFDGFSHHQRRISDHEFRRCRRGSVCKRPVYNAFVTKLNPTGTALEYSTFLGGSIDDFGYAIAVDGSGDAYVTGQSWSNNFPVRGAHISPLTCLRQ